MPVKKIRFTQHALAKIKILRQHKVNISPDFVKEVLISPDRIDSGYKERKIAQKVLDKTHVLRVIFEETPEEWVIITLYPGRRERYE